MIEIIQAIFQPQVLVFLIPIAGIMGGVYLKAQKIKAGKRLDKQDKELLEKLIEENNTLRGRVDNLESIVTGLDDELLSLKAGQESADFKVRSLH